MDATRMRRRKDPVRQRWYAACRCRRLARHLGFGPACKAKTLAAAR